MLPRVRALAAGCDGVSDSLNRVAAVIPTLNEAETIAGTIGLLPRDVVDEIIVADSSSRDRTVAIAEAAGARTVTLTLSAGW